MNSQSQSTFVDRLIPIWQRLLGKSSVGIHDDFFELGGTAAIANKLFAEATSIGARLLPPVMIFSAPTIASIAALMEQPGSARLPPVVLLKKGNQQSPVFLSHGLGGSVLDLLALAQHIESDRPIFGLQAKGAEGIDEPHDRVENMAQFHLEAMKQIQPHGPYILIGYSFGGLVMLDIAQRLRENGEQIALFVMVDTYPNKRYLRPMSFFRLATRLAKRRIFVLFRTPQSDPREVLTPEVQRQREKNYLALARYRPRSYPGEVRFLKAAEVSDFPEDPVAVWSHLIAKFAVDTVPGNHFEMLTSHSEALSSVLSRYLKETV